MKIYFLFFILIFLVINGCSSEIKRVCINENCFFVEIADSAEEKEKGLMNREVLEKNKGMLFVFEEEGNYSFWMKNTLIPLDLIWINSEKQVVFIKENAQFCKENCEIYENNQKAKYVLEINAGKVKELDIKIGDTAKF